jgi:hypothetical protein
MNAQDLCLKNAFIWPCIHFCIRIIAYFELMSIYIQAIVHFFEYILTSIAES